MIDKKMPGKFAEASFPGAFLFQHDAGAVGADLHLFIRQLRYALAVVVQPADRNVPQIGFCAPAVEMNRDRLTAGQADVFIPQVTDATEP